jgi:hypothetical protein
MTLQETEQEIDGAEDQDGDDEEFDLRDMQHALRRISRRYNSLLEELTHSLASRGTGIDRLPDAVLADLELLSWDISKLLEEE